MKAGFDFRNVTTSELTAFVVGMQYQGKTEQPLYKAAVAELENRNGPERDTSHD